jgi:hypothetical protein
MADGVKRKIVYRVQKRDGLPKACSVDDWLEACRIGDTRPLFGGVVWYRETLCMVARIGGKIHALPFEKCTASNPFRDALTAEDQAHYDKMRADGIAGSFDAWVMKKRKEISADVGF